MTNEPLTDPDPQSEREPAVVVSGDPARLEHLQGVLGESGFDPFGCTSAEEALKRTSTATLVVTDLPVRGIEGAELCRRIRRSGTGAYPFLLVLGGWDREDGVEAALGAGADDFIAPGATRAELLHRLRVVRTRLAREVGGRERQDELAARNRELSALYRISALTVEEGPVEGAYEPILEEIARLMRVPIVLLERLDAAGESVRIHATHGIDLPGITEMPPDRTLSGDTVLYGRPTAVRGALHEEHHLHEAFAEIRPQAWASFPLYGGGALTLIDRRDREIDESWMRLGSTLAQSVASLVARVENSAAIRTSEARHRSLALQLEQANQELEAFSYSVSHDLRSPLRTMQGFTHALLRDYGDVLDEQAHDFINRILGAGRQSERLISDLLAYSRLSFQDIELQPIPLRDVIDEAMERIQGDLEDAGARVTVPRTLPTVSGNQTALVQVVSNLLSNAAKFVPEDREPEVNVRAEEHDDFTRLWVEDNGVGIPEGQESRIFGVFERLDGIDRPGTGIGLAIVRRAMERIDGSCGVKRLDRGSAFWIDARSVRSAWARQWFKQA